MSDTLIQLNTIIEFIKKIQLNSIYKSGDFSYYKVDELDNKNLTSTIYNYYELEKYLKKDFDKFINIIESEDAIKYPFLTKIKAHESDYVTIFNQYFPSYIISSFLKNKNIYRNFPLFFKECATYFKNNKYKDLSIDELEKFLGKYLDLKKSYDYKSDRIITEIQTKPKNLYTDYSKYDNALYNNEFIDLYNPESFFVWSEYTAMNWEKKYLLQYPNVDPNKYLKWVSRNHGDGYGFDILSYDLFDNKEKLIEVKSGKTDDYDLTKNEHMVARKTIEFPNVDYYIYTFYFDIRNKFIKPKILKYDNIKDELVNIENINEIYNLIPYTYNELDDYGRIVKKDKVKILRKNFI